MNWLRERALRRQAKVGEITALLTGARLATQDGYAAPTRHQRLLAWLFPRPGVPPLAESPEYVPGYLETHVITHFGWKDRLRILITGRVHACLRTKTDEVISKSYTHATVWVEPRQP